MADHSYEELRATVLDVLAGCVEVFYTPNQYEHLVLAVGETLARREGRAGRGFGGTYRLPQMSTYAQGCSETSSWIAQSLCGGCPRSFHDFA